MKPHAHNAKVRPAPDTCLISQSLWRVPPPARSVSQTATMMAKAMMKSMVAVSHSVLSNIDVPAAEASSNHLRKSSGSGKDRASLWHCGAAADRIPDAAERRRLLRLPTRLRRGRYPRHNAETAR
jgi:hypothetical protein